jgi:ribosomal protein L24E
MIKLANQKRASQTKLQSNPRQLQYTKQRAQSLKLFLFVIYYGKFTD